MIPLATTTITVERSNQDGTRDAYDGVSFSTLKRGVRAVISAPSGAEVNAGGSSEDVSATLTCDVTDLRHDDRITTSDGETYEVTWARLRGGMGLDHMSAGLRKITDRADG